MKLPASLAPWAKHLQIFPEEVSLTLGEYVRKISPFISPLNAENHDETGEPNGYDGVARRGIYERLLISELALAEDFSEEFIRRAVMGEHLFLNLAKVSPAAKRISVALFDSGAIQLGAPRIAHLAAFIVLARRAEAANSMFLWGVLQDEKQLVISDDTEASVKILLESRKADEVSEDDISEWREKLKNTDEMSDVWLIGSEKIGGFDKAKKFSHLYVDEILDIEKRQLSLKVKSASSIEKSTVLELPPPNMCTRLLRNPFENLPKMQTTKANLGGNITNFFFDNSGSKLFAKLDSHAVLVFSVQNLQSSGKIYPNIYHGFDSQYSKAVPYIAAGRLRKATAVGVKVDDHTLRLDYRKMGFGLPKGLYCSHNDKIIFPTEETGLLQILNVRPKKISYDEAALLDADGNLFLLNELVQKTNDPNQITGTLRILATNVLAVAQSNDKFVYIGCEDGNEFHRIVSISDKVERHSLSGMRLKKAFFGRGENGANVAAFMDEVENWKVLDENFKERIMPKPKGEVVGVIHDSRLAPVSGLFELMEDRRTIDFCWQYGRRKHILTAKDEIVKIQFSPRSPILAYQTADGELVLFSLTHRAAIGTYSK